MKRMLLCSVTVVALLFSSLQNFAQAPNLGTAADFVLFTTVGAVGNTGISHLTGNVGTNSGSSTGFGNVNGVMHDGDGASGIAATDLLFAYNQLDIATPTFFPAPILGNGDTLIAGVYQTTAVTKLTSTLYLDAQGNSNAVFIFQIEAAFSTDANSKVKLINGAQACNVFWKVEGLVDIAAGTSMKGNIVVHDAAINMNTNDTLEGRALAINGAIAIDGVFAYTPIGCLSPLLSGPAEPTLGTAACYALFSGNGAVANAGISRITGDVGTNVGLTTGYDPLFVNGTIHPGPDGSTAQCKDDLLVAYDYLNLLAADIELLYPAQFGRNLVLTPHTYIMNGAATFTDSLYLNAQGVPNAIFVIKIKGALDAQANSKVFLVNGTLAKNVYWVVDGAVSIHDNSVFNGTIICNNGAIDLTTGTTLNGRALTTDGALSTAAVYVTSPSPVCAFVLPVTWLYFTGKPAQQNVLLEWGTTNEMNNGFFTLERSKDGNMFETITTVNATKATTAGELNYSFTDKQPYSLGFYRVSQTDKDGQVNNYRTIQVKSNISQQLNAQHYVQGNYIYVRTAGAVPGNGTITLFSMDGKKMSTQKILLTREATTYKIVRSLQKGMYVIYIESRGENLYHGRVMVQ